VIFTSAVPPGSGMSEDVLKYTNEYRKSKRLSALVMRNDLNAIARRHSEDMANGRRSFGHGGFEQRVSKVRKIFGTCNVSENVLMAPGMQKKFSRSGKIQVVIARTCWVIINIQALV